MKRNQEPELPHPEHNLPHPEKNLPPVEPLDLPGPEDFPLDDDPETDPKE